MIAFSDEDSQLLPDGPRAPLGSVRRGRPTGNIVVLQKPSNRSIVPLSEQPVNPVHPSRRRTRRKKARGRRQSHGLAWHWQQTDCWYYTLPGTKKRIPLFDEDGGRIRGIENKHAAQLALARVKLAGEWQPTAEPPAFREEWLVARVCSEYIQYCERGVANGTVSEGHRNSTVMFLNDLCKFCGALPVSQLKKGHIQTWVGNHPSWKSPATQRAAIAIVLAAFNSAEENHDVASPLKGLKKPRAQPRLQSFSKADEMALYGKANEAFRNFLFAAIHTGLRPFCELARITADDVEETPRGMMWRVFASKTKKTRKIPVRSEVAVLTRKLMTTAPRGSSLPIFRNTLGGAWNKQSGVMRFCTVRKRLGWDTDPVRKRFSTYSSRHTFAHRMLSGYWNGGVGCSIETLAELIGDTPKVAFDHYGREWGQHYQDPLWAAVGGKPAPTDSRRKSARVAKRRTPR